MLCQFQAYHSTGLPFRKEASHHERLSKTEAPMQNIQKIILTPPHCEEAQ